MNMRQLIFWFWHFYVVKWHCEVGPFSTKIGFVKTEVPMTVLTCKYKCFNVTSWITSSATFSGKYLNLNANFWITSFLTSCWLSLLVRFSHAGWFLTSVNCNPKYQTYKETKKINKKKLCTFHNLYLLQHRNSTWNFIIDLSNLCFST